MKYRLNKDRSVNCLVSSGGSGVQITIKKGCVVSLVEKIDKTYIQGRITSGHIDMVLLFSTEDLTPIVRVL